MEDRNHQQPKDSFNMIEDLIHIERVRTALSHSTSWDVQQGAESNQVLETVGDAFIGFNIAKWLYEGGVPTEKEITLIRSRIVSNVSLAKIGRRIGIPKYLKVNNKYKITSKDVADAFEALVGAMVLEIGSEQSENWLYEIIREDVLKAITQEEKEPNKEGRNEFNPTNRLQEYAQSKGFSKPKYPESFSEDKGTFKIECHFRNGNQLITSHGVHRQVKEAKKRAASHMLKKLKVSA